MLEMKCPIYMEYVVAINPLQLYLVIHDTIFIIILKNNNRLQVYNTTS